MSDTLLIIEDETLLGSELTRHYRQLGWEVAFAETAEAARTNLFEQRFDPLVVLSDMNLPDGNALDLLQEVRNRNIVGEWIFLTAYGGVPDSVRAMHLGAFDFLEKPCDLGRLDLVISGAARSGRAQRRLRDQAARQTRKYSPQSFVGHSSAALEVQKMLEKLAHIPFSALIITGETGTGKGLTARILHHSGGRAEGGQLIEINCAALPKDLLESELFGHEAGAFTGAKGRRRGLFEHANGGTLFLDEIGELDLSLQSKLLKAIEDRSIRRLGGDKEIKVDVQIIAATNHDLEMRIKEGHFRSDLYHRLSAFRLHLPSLRQRKEDLEDLVPLFVTEFNSSANKAVKVIPQDVWSRLYEHAWPGNVRELRNVVERCVLFADSDIFPAQWLQLFAPGNTQHSSGPEVDGDRICIPLNGTMALDDMDCYIIKTALDRNKHNVTATARALGTTRETLRYRIQKYGLKTTV